MERPVWLMRQAGRYLPEYRALRAPRAGSSRWSTIPAAAEVTLQPIRRFGFDGAILFSDILIVPYAMGQDLVPGGRGSAAQPAASRCDAGQPSCGQRAADPDLRDRRAGRRAAGRRATFLGFAGSPWTVATYMVAGRGRGPA